MLVLWIFREFLILEFRDFMELMVSYCGICCSLCPAFREKACPGCKELLKLHGKCEIAKCASQKGISCCFLCESFPCKLFEEGFNWNLDEIPEFKKFKLGVVKWKPYSKLFIKLFKLWKRKV